MQLQGETVQSDLHQSLALLGIATAGRYAAGDGRSKAQEHVAKQPAAEQLAAELKHPWSSVWLVHCHLSALSPACSSPPACMFCRTTSAPNRYLLIVIGTNDRRKRQYRGQQIGIVRALHRPAKHAILSRSIFGVLFIVLMVWLLRLVVFCSAVVEYCYTATWHYHL